MTRHPTTTKILLAAPVAVAVAVLSVAFATAGQKYVSNVTVDTADREARGPMGSARNSADTVQYIGCYLTSNGTGATLVCSARNTSGVVAGCSTTNGALIEVFKSAVDSSWLDFTWTNGQCTSLTVATDSKYEPKR